MSLQSCLCLVQRSFQHVWLFLEMCNSVTRGLCKRLWTEQRLTGMEARKLCTVVLSKLDTQMFLLN